MEHNSVSNKCMVEMLMHFKYGSFNLFFYSLLFPPNSKAHCFFSLLIQAMHAAPMYISETAPSQIRGQLISLKEFFIVLGMVVSTAY